MLAPDSPGRSGSARSHAVRRATAGNTTFRNPCRDAARATRMHLHVVHPERGKTIVTVDTTAELMNTRPLVLAPAVDVDPMGLPSRQWLPAVSASRESLNNPQGWYR